MDYGLTDIVAEQYDAGVRTGEQVGKDMIAVRIAPRHAHGGGRRALLFQEPCRAEEAAGSDRDTTVSICVCPRMAISMPGSSRKAAASFEVRVEGQLTCNGSAHMFTAALSGLGLAYIPEGLAEPHIAKGPPQTRADGLVPAVFGIPPLLCEPPSIVRGVQPRRRCAAASRISIHLCWPKPHLQRVASSFQDSLGQ